MNASRQKLLLILVLGLLASVIGLSFKPLASQVRFGLEFRGGYEIYYVVASAPGKTSLTQKDLLATVDVLRQRADAIGMAEPDIRLEGANHIRVKLAGVTSADESRSLLGSSQGLPTQLTEKYTQTVGSVLGKTALAETLCAGLIGIACIVLLIVALYRTAGLLAAFCTAVYLWLLIALFNASHAVLSLSAVVAFVLGIGMAADASIICFERAREGLRAGLPLRDAMRQGFGGSLPTIRDANSVTALAMVALFAAGIGPIQGFALTMLASLAISFATNFFLLRTLVLWLAGSGWLNEAQLIGRGRARQLDKPAFNFLACGKAVALVAALMIVSGTLFYRAHGLNLDIDFTAGTALDIDLDRAISQDDATRIMADAGTVPATLAVGGAHSEHIAARFDEVLKPEALKPIITAFQARYSKVEYEENTADPGVARDFATHSIYAILAAFASIALYIAVRFGTSAALATLLAIILDTLLVTAIFARFKLEIDVTYIAALLTIIGYSLNDKIVIFGRIVENHRQRHPETSAALRELVNDSIRQTLGRSLYTVLTVVMASTALYFFACEPLQMFALALVLGLISGAVSSIFIASSLWWYLQRFTGEPVLRPVSRSFLGALGLLLAIGALGWYATPPSADAQASTQSSLHGGLGDLSAFRAITVDTQTLVRAGKLDQAKARIKDLETAWDKAEETLRPASPDDWTSVDKSIDRALAQLRSGQPSAADCEAALQSLLAKIDSKQPSPAPLAASATLGDLSAFRRIATDTAALVDSGQLVQAKARIKDLESAWDDAEEQLRSKAPEDWISVDKSIDRALAQLRSGSPDRNACAAALQTLIAKIDSKAQL